MNRISLDDDRDVLIWREGSGRSVEIFDIVVGSERGKGKGRRLIAALLAELPEGTSMVYAITRLGNTIAHQFYEALGFRIVGRLHHFYRDTGGNESALMYGLEL